MTQLTHQRREEVAQIILDLITEEGNLTEDEQWEALCGIARRQQEVSEKTGIHTDEIEAFCWEMVKLMIRTSDN